MLTFPFFTKLDGLKTESFLDAFIPPTVFILTCILTLLLLGFLLLTLESFLCHDFAESLYTDGAALCWRRFCFFRKSVLHCWDFLWWWRCHSKSLFDRKDFFGWRRPCCCGFIDWNRTRNSIRGNYHQWYLNSIDYFCIWVLCCWYFHNMLLNHSLERQIFQQYSIWQANWAS